MQSCRMKVPESGKIYAFNEGNYAGWEKGLQDYMMSLKDAEKHGGKPYSARYARHYLLYIHCDMYLCWTLVCLSFYETW